MPGSALVFLALFCAAPASVVSHRRHHTVKRVHEDPPADDRVLNPTEECEKMCKEDTGIDADPDYCATECAVYTDLNNHKWEDEFGTQEAVQRFVEDESYNEKDGKAMEKKFEEEFGEEVLDCAPSVDVDKEPTMEDLDVKKDGVVDKEEAEIYGKKACVPDEMTDQIFEEADVNQDHQIDKQEFAEAGEDTVAEEELDEALEGNQPDAAKGEAPFEGDDEHAVVDNQDFEEIDANKDEKIDAGEFQNNAEFESEKRMETNAAHVPVTADDADMVADANPSIDKAMDKVDTNDDGEISKEEFEATDGGGSDLGEEMSEAANQNEDMPDADDSKRVDGAELLSTKFHRAQRAESALLSKFAVMKPRHKMVMLQRSKHAKNGFAAALHAAQQHHAKLRQQRSHSRRSQGTLRHGHLRRHRRA